MADENPNPTPATNPADPPAPAPAPASTAAISLSREEFDRQMAEARRTGERSARESQEIRDLRQKAKQYDDTEASKRSAEERLTAERDAEKLRAETFTGKYRTALIKSAFIAQATEKGVPADRVEDAYRLADLAGITVDEDTDTVKGVEGIVKSLVESRPYLVGTATGDGRRAAPDLNAGGANKPANREQQIEQARKEMAVTGRYAPL